MILRCPNCDTAYRVAVEALGPMGRRVRCSKCRNVWHAVPPEGAIEAVTVEIETATEDAADAPGPDVRGGLPARIEPRRKGRTAFLRWLAPALVLGLLAVVLFEREAIMAEWSRSEAVYEALGLHHPPPGDGLALHISEARQEIVDGRTVLVVTGEIANVTDRMREVPPLRVALPGPDGTGTQRIWPVFSAERSRLPPGGKSAFRVVLEGAIGTATKVIVTFGRGEAD